jgi:Fur family ferric uptake transcriptional regulator
MKKAKDVFMDFMNDKKLRKSVRRDSIVDLFLKTEGHITPEELYIYSKEEDPSIGVATVYRTLKLLCKSGLARELKFRDGVSRYEHLYGHPHHDHLICQHCGKFVEVVDPKIEQLQTLLAERHGFTIESHTTDIYGYCSRCRSLKNH